MIGICQFVVEILQTKYEKVIDIVTVADSLFYCNYVRLIVHVVLPLLSLAPPSS